MLKISIFDTILLILTYSFQFNWRQACIQSPIFLGPQTLCIGLNVKKGMKK